MTPENNFIFEFQTAMTTAGISCEEAIIPDGTLHRFTVAGDKPNSLTGWYILYHDAIPAGAFGCWRRDIKQNWCNHNLQALSSEERIVFNKRMEEAREKRKKEQEKLHLETKKRAEQIWNESTAASDHPYLALKNVKSYGLRIYKNSLVIPIFDTKNILHNLQFIYSENNQFKKRFLAGGKKKGLSFLIGEIINTIYIAEGYATAATIHEATQCGVFVAFDCGNLLEAAKNIRDKYHKHNLIIAADNDQFTPNNPGLTKAKEAALAIGSRLLLPNFNNLNLAIKPTDFNDLMQLAGIDEVKRQLAIETQIITEEASQKKTVAVKVMELLTEIEFFHDEYRDAYVTIKRNNHYETWLIESNQFKEWLSKIYWDAYKGSLNKNSLNEVVSLIKGKALHDGGCHKVFIRVAELDNRIYIDLANEQREIVEVTSTGWQIIADAPVKFKTIAAMRPLPRPEDGGNINELFSLINIPQKSQKLVFAWMLECFRVNTHFPILVFSGMQGSAKSTTQNILRSLIDPSASNLRNAPRKSEDLLVNAKNNWLVSFNNLSNLTSQEQDDLCCLSTGGGFSARRLYTNGEEELFDIKRPVILNGITDLITQQDLIDRCIVIELPAISNKQRRTDQELTIEFNEKAARIFGSLLTALSKVLAELPTVKLYEKPRLADFALLGVALEKALGWEQNSFMKDYTDARVESITLAMEHSPVATAIIELIEARAVFDGSYSSLYKDLTKNFKPDMAGWPKSAKGLANQLRRQAPALKMTGIEIIFDPSRKNDGYHIKIIKSENNVHQVHQVHNPNAGAGSKGELTSECVHTHSLTSPKVHAAKPYVPRASEYSVLSEHRNDKKLYNQDRERFVV